MTIEPTPNRSAQRAACTALRTFAFAAVVAAAAGTVPVPAPAASAKACAMLSTGELSSILGQPMQIAPGMDVPQALGCDWHGTSGHDAFLTVRIVPLRYFPEPSSHIPGYKALHGVGDGASWVHPELGGWTGGATKGKKAVVIQVSGGKAGAGTAVTLLKTLIARM